MSPQITDTYSHGLEKGGIVMTILYCNAIYSFHINIVISREKINLVCLIEFIQFHTEKNGLGQQLLSIPSGRIAQRAPMEAVD